MQSSKLVLCVLVLTLLAACSSQNPAVPRVGGAAQPNSAVADGRGDDGQRDGSQSGGDDEEGRDREHGRRGRLYLVARLSATPVTIQKGQSATLTWSTDNARTATLDGAPVSLDGTRQVSPAVTTTYTLVATNPLGSRSARVTVTVAGTQPPPTSTAPAANLSASPASIQSGQSSTLTWSSTNATSVTLNGATVALNGSQSVSPTATTSYTLVAAGAGGSATARATVTVSSTPPPPAATPTASLSASPASIQSGQSSTLSWSSTNATSVTLNGAAVALNGSRVVSPTATTSYSLVATGAGGNATANATVTVAAAPPPPPPPAGLTYTTDVAPILSAHCTSCHSGSSPAAGINLSSYAGVMTVVTPGSANSRLVTATQPGGAMSGFLGSSAAQLAETIRSWVVSWGAKQ